MSITTDEVFNIRENARSRQIPCVTKNAGDKLKFMSRHTIEYLTYTDAISMIAMNIAQNSETESYLMWISSESGTIDNGGESISYYPFDLIFTKTTDAGISFVSDRICNVINPNTMKAVMDNTNSTLIFYYDSINHDGEGTIYEFGDTRTWLVDEDGNPLEEDTTVQYVKFDETFQNARPRYCAHWFDNLTALDSIENIEYLNTSECLDMSYMFQRCIKLRNLYVDYFDIDKVKAFDYMFNNCSILTAIYSTNLGSDNYWVGDNASDTYMFNGCSKLNNCYNPTRITKNYAYVAADGKGYFMKSPRKE